MNFDSLSIFLSKMNAYLEESVVSNAYGELLLDRQRVKPHDITQMVDQFHVWCTFLSQRYIPR